MDKDLKTRHAEESAIAITLMAEVQIKSAAIRARLAAVARDLRNAAATAETGSEHLLNLASRFEHQSQARDNAWSDKHSA